ncbi:MAG: SDR family NAD(P)-dependent oxidoreductase [Alphaproteobacteria bacterium]|nr:SDR family NAD(P)-dependent oxidoreductase [Alphaproteobacteria bacterium]
MQNPKHILITGASSGVGAALALEYAAAGITLSLHGRNRERLLETATKARGHGATVAIRDGDVSQATDMADWLAERDAVQPLDLVIANAGISGATSRVHQMAEQTKAIFDVNVLGVFNTIHPALPLMKDRGKGQIAILSSLAGFCGFAGASAYGASKAAIRIYGEALRCEMAPFGVEVNVVCPGFIRTPMTNQNHCPMPFLMTPERAAKRIREGLERNLARVAFPWQMYAAIRLLIALPNAVMERISRKLPRK